MKNQILLTLFLVLSVFFIGLTNIAAQEGPSLSVSGGGVLVKGWTGKIDVKEQAAGLTLNSAKLAKEGKALHVTTGPAVTYWNPKNKAKGDYTVKATFREPKYMSINDHPHPYGIVIAGSDHSAFGSLSNERMLRPWRCFGVGRPHRSQSVG